MYFKRHRLLRCDGCDGLGQLLFLFSLEPQFPFVCFGVHFFAMVSKHQLERFSEIGQAVQTIWTDNHVVKGHAYRVRREGFLIKDGNLGIPLAKVSQQGELGSHRTAYFNSLQT